MPQVAHGDRDDDAHEGCDRSDGEVDVADDDHHDHADGEYQDVAVAVEQVHEVGRGDHQAAGETVEQDGQGDQDEQHAELAKTAAEQLLESVHRSTFSRHAAVVVLVGTRVNEAHQALLSGFFGVDAAGDDAGADGVDAVAGPEEFREFRRDHHDGLARVGEGVHDAVHLVASRRHRCRASVRRGSTVRAP